MHGDTSYGRIVNDGFKDLINREEIKLDVICGSFLSGIPFGKSLADYLEKPFSYARGNDDPNITYHSIEGFRKFYGNKFVVVDDFVRMADDTFKAVEAIRSQGGICNYVVSIFDLQFEGTKEKFRELLPPVEIKSLLNFDKFVELGLEKRYFDQRRVDSLYNWRNNLERNLKLKIR